MLDDFLAKNWFDLLQSVFIVGGFILAIYAFRGDVHTRKVDHLLRLIENQRSIWDKLYSHPELLRVKKRNIDLEAEPIAEIERRMVKEVIMHAYAVYEAIQNKLFDKGEMEKDIAVHFRMPMIDEVWQEVRGYYKKDFVDYIEALVAQR